MSQIEALGGEALVLLTVDETREIITHLRDLLRENAALRADAARLDDISRPGASTRVFTRALENKADPRTAVVAAAKVPMSAHSFIVSERPTLREAIDSACGNEQVREHRAKSCTVGHSERGANGSEGGNG